MDIPRIRYTSEDVAIKALKTIVNYVLPFYLIEGRKYVPLENAVELQTLAREGLTPPKES